MENRNLDVVIIGGGPAGMSAGIWCKDLGLSSVVLEKESEPGGQLLSIYNPIKNYPGLVAENGRELRDRFLETAKSYGVEIIVSTEVVDLNPKSLSVTTAAGDRYSARSIILATGVRRRRLNIPGETEFAGKGILESGSRDKESTRGKTVAIIGGGDAALENALILAEYCKKVYVIHRRDRFTARSEFIRKAYANPSIEFVLKARAAEISGTDQVEAIGVTKNGSTDIQTMAVDAVLIRIGVEAQTGLLQSKAGLDRKGYVLIDLHCRTNASGLYAIGDVANFRSPTLATAAGTGASATKDLFDRLARE